MRVRVCICKREKLCAFERERLREKSLCVSIKVMCLAKNFGLSTFLVFRHCPTFRGSKQVWYKTPVFKCPKILRNFPKILPKVKFETPVQKYTVIFENSENSGIILEMHLLIQKSRLNFRKFRHLRDVSHIRNVRHIRDIRHDAIDHHMHGYIGLMIQKYAQNCSCTHRGRDKWLFVF